MRSENLPLSRKKSVFTPQWDTLLDERKGAAFAAGRGVDDAQAAAEAASKAADDAAAARTGE